ncbi:MAG TPA: ABC transporter substrate-binding protein [Aggregatilineales bacterium]|nr:ABC transporter substrate-binding protein [Anaerolineae bacterium]HUN06723.1 ABC transporter substrate-binding protein [Aggregatilineales bacterium]
MRTKALLVLMALLLLVGMVSAQDTDIVTEHSTDYLNDETLAVQEGEEVDTSAYAKEGPYTIGFINWSTANSWTVQIDEEIKHEATLYPEIEELITVSSDGDVNKQITQIEDMISLGVDALLVIPVATEPIIPALELAKEQGIPVVVFASAPPGEDTQVTTLWADQVLFGRLQGDFLMEELGCAGNIIVLNGLAGIATSDLRRQGLQEAIEACPDGGAGVTVLAEEDALWAYDQGKLAVERMLAAFPEIDGVWSQGGAMTQGAIDAFEAAGRPLVPMTGEDNNGFMLAWQERAADGFEAIAASEPTWQSRVALQAALRILQGIPVNSFYRLQVPTITSETLEQYVRPEYSDAYWTNSLLPKEVADEIYMEASS